MGKGGHRRLPAVSAGRVSQPNNSATPPLLMENLACPDSDALTRTALALQAFGVTEFATANIKDFEGLGFAKVWNPIANK